MPAVNALCLLQGHKSFVKGLAWDPVGTYLASAADDKCVIIWRTDGWQPVATITAPFRHGFSTSTFFLRLDWAPCECPAGSTWAIGPKCTDRIMPSLTGADSGPSMVPSCMWGWPWVAGRMWLVLKC